MKRRIGLIWAVSLFFLPTVYAQATSADSVAAYHTWPRPHLGYVAESDIWVGVFVSRHGTAYTHRSGSTGAIVMIHARYDGVCYQSSDGTQWVARSCHAFLAVDGAFRAAAEQHRRRKAAGKTDER